MADLDILAGFRDQDESQTLVAIGERSGKIYRHNARWLQSNKPYLADQTATDFSGAEVLSVYTPDARDSIEVLFDEASSTLAVTGETKLRNYWSAEKYGTTAWRGKTFDTSFEVVRVPNWENILIYKGFERTEFDRKSAPHFAPRAGAESPVFQVDGALRVIQCSVAARFTLGRRFREVLGKPLNEFLVFHDLPFFEQDQANDLAYACRAFPVKSTVTVRGHIADPEVFEARIALNEVSGRTGFSVTLSKPDETVVQGGAVKPLSKGVPQRCPEPAAPHRAQDDKAQAEAYEVAILAIAAAVSTIDSRTAKSIPTTLEQLASKIFGDSPVDQTARALTRDYADRLSRFLEKWPD